MLKAAALRALWISLLLTAVSVWGMASWNAHGGVGLLAAFIVPAMWVVAAMRPTDSPLIQWPLIAAVTLGWVWAVAMVLCLGFAYLSREANRPPR